MPTWFYVVALIVPFGWVIGLLVYAYLRARKLDEAGVRLIRDANGRLSTVPIHAGPHTRVSGCHHYYPEKGACCCFLLTREGGHQ